MSNSFRSRLLAVLSPRAIIRTSVDLGCGAGLATLTGELIAEAEQRGLRWDDLLTVLLGVVIGCIAGVFCAGFLRRFVFLLQRTSGVRLSWLQLWLVLVSAVVCVAIAVALQVAAGNLWADVAGVAARAVPAVLVVVFGVWTWVLAQRRFHDAERRWLRWTPDVLVALVSGLAFLVLFRPELLATEPAAGLLFPLAGWFSVRTWRAMEHSGRLAVRAGADIAMSLLLGADLVLFLVWLANLFDLPAAEVTVLRDTLERTGDIADLPWWLWAGLYVVLAAASLAFALWPRPLGKVSDWWKRLRAVPSIDLTRRVLSGLHMGLAVTMLIGLTAPAALDTSLRARIQAQYALAVRNELAAEGEQAAYEEISAEFSTSVAALPALQPLIAIVDKVHTVSSPEAGNDEATSTERDIARRLGQVQAATLQVSPPRAGQPGAAAPGAAGPGRGEEGEGSGDAAELRGRLDQLDEQQQRTRAAHKQADEAGELAAAAVASAIQIPGLGDHEIVQVITEYLSGLVESSPLKDVFSAWARRLVDRATLPRADRLVVPDPRRLEAFAFTILIKEQLTVRLADPFSGAEAQERAFRESPGDAAVDLVNQTRFLEEDSGPCEGCAHPLEPGDEPVEGPGEPHEEPPHEVIP